MQREINTGTLFYVFEKTLHVPPISSLKRAKIVRAEG